eukprot:Selendium_serpulae@DN6503_c1_g1_i3.p1
MIRSISDSFAFALLTTALAAICCFDVVLFPYTNVEESFNTQAVHDITQSLLNFGDSTERIGYDHLRFPGVVPRTFVGALILAFATTIVHYAFKIFLGITLTGGGHLITARLTQASLWVCSVVRLGRTIKTSLGYDRALLFLFTLLLQFHLLFYSSRFLPNTFALCCCTWALSDFVKALTARAETLEKESSGNPATRCLTILSLTAAVFRCDIILILLPCFLYITANKGVGLRSSCNAVLFGVFAGAGLSMLVDTFFWSGSKYSKKSPFPADILWPEAAVFFFNTVLNKSHEWGISPWHSYFTSMLPRGLGPLCFICLVLALLWGTQEVVFKRLFSTGLKAPFCHKTWNTFVDVAVPVAMCWGFPVVALSLLGHKEMRFIFPSMTGLSLVATWGIDLFWDKHSFPIFMRGAKDKKTDSASASRYPKTESKIWLSRRLLLLSLGVVTISMSSARRLASYFNYPGSVALQGFYSRRMYSTISREANTTGKRNTVPAGKRGVYPFLLPHDWYHESHSADLIDGNERQLVARMPISIFGFKLPQFVPIGLEVEDLGRNMEVNTLLIDSRKEQSRSTKSCSVHLDHVAAESGVSRFLHRDDLCVVSKTEGLMQVSHSVAVDT